MEFLELSMAMNHEKQIEQQKQVHIIQKKGRRKELQKKRQLKRRNKFFYL